MDESGLPVPGFVVGWEPPPGAGLHGEKTALTDLDGCVTSPTATRAWFHDPTGQRAVDLTGVVTEAVVRGLPSLRIAVVNGVTGEPFPADIVVPRRGPNGVQIDVPAVRDGTDAVIASFPLDSGPNMHAVPVASVPDGFVAVAEAIHIPSLPSTVRSIRAFVFVYREADVRLSVSDASGAAAAPEIERIEPARAVTDFDFERIARAAKLAETTVPGTWRVTGLPAMPRLRVRIWVSATAVETDEGGVGGGRGVTRWLDLDRGGSSVLSLAMGEPAMHGAAGNSTMGIGGRISRPGRSDGPLQPVRVRVLRADGAPAANAVVVSATGEIWTDEQGRATIRIPEGRNRIVALADDLLPTTQEITVPCDGEFVLRSPLGRSVEITVVDPEDRPIALARVRAATVSILDSGGEVIPWSVNVPRIDGDTLWATIRTDARGRVVLDRVPAGMLRVTASLGSSLGTTESDAAMVRVVALQGR